MASDPRSSAETDQKVPPELRASTNVEWMRVFRDCRALQPPRRDRYRQFFSCDAHDDIYVRVILDQHVAEARAHPITTSWSTQPHRVHHGLHGSAVLRLNVVRISSALASSSCLASRTSCGFPTALAWTPSSLLDARLDTHSLRVSIVARRGCVSSLNTPDVEQEPVPPEADGRLASMTARSSTWWRCS